MLAVDFDGLAAATSPVATADPDVERAAYQTEVVWDFRTAPPDGGRDFGNANVWSFDSKLEVLVREVVQNARDAATGPDSQVSVVFRIIRLSGADKQDFLAALKWTDLQGHLEATAANGQKLGTILRNGLDRLEDDELILLSIEDRGTVGLTGPERDNGHFTALCRNNLDSNKDGTKGGAYGLGKAVLWRASRFSTVLFCSHLSEPVDGKSRWRVFGRCELAWHGLVGLQYAGPGWFGRRAHDGETASSFWENETLVSPLTTLAMNSPGLLC